MKTVTLPENTVEILVDAARLGVQFLQSHETTQVEDHYEKNNINSQIRRTETAIQDVENQTINSGAVSSTPSAAEQMSLNAELRRTQEDRSGTHFDFTEDKTNFIEGKR